MGRGTATPTTTRLRARLPGPSPQTSRARLALRAARAELMRSEGYGAGYRYARDDAPEGMNARYLPEELGDRVYYEPRESGSEAEIRARVDRWREERTARGQRAE